MTSEDISSCAFYILTVSYVVISVRLAALVVIAAAATETAAAAATKDKQDDDDPATGIISKIKHITNSILPLRAGL